ncbi:hypothetical protein [Mycobacterium deserti]|uniref:Uncharacterized protein n=1 Tax=Mycobacterium deserti TaxID=2978347 RepID=A0ABT2MHB7_9MYCO|nr:hypothetical protein [Mycobacterium deserti]MCT7661688.1 hypothetical protein [Mycobacterium deserti]
MNKFNYAATLLGAFAVIVLTPATAYATDNDPSGPGGCTYTDADGYDIPIHDGEDVFVDGKIVSCRGGSIIITTAPKRGGGGLRPQTGGPLPVLTEVEPAAPVSPKRPVLSDTPILTAQN